MLHNVEKRTLGLNFTASSVADALVWAPYATTVSIKFEENEVSLAKTDKGYWKAEALGGECR